MRDEDVGMKKSWGTGGTTTTAGEPPTRKQRLERSLRPSSSRFASPPKMRDRFDTWNVGRNHAARHKSSNQNIPANLDISHTNTRSSKEKVTTPHAGEEIVFTTSMTTSGSGGKDEFRQDGGSNHSRGSRRKVRTTTRNRKSNREDAAANTASSEDDSTEIGFEVSVTHMATAKDDGVPSEEGNVWASVLIKEEGGNHRGESSSERSSIVFNFSGISKTKSTELTVSDGPVDITSSLKKSQENDEEFLALYQEIEKIVSRLSTSTVRTPKAANRSQQDLAAAAHPNAFYQYYCSAKTLTSVYSNGGELSFGIHAEIMKLIGALDSGSTADQKQGIVQDLYKMGIRVLATITNPDHNELQVDQDGEGSVSHSSMEDHEETQEDVAKIGSACSHSTHQDDQGGSTLQDSNSLSSDDIDRRWEAYRAKYMERQAPSSSGEVDDRWERFRERALTSGIEKKDSGALSLTSDMEDDLIRDCIETGLPSPRMTQTWGGSRSHREDNAFDEKTSLHAPIAHTHSMHKRMPVPRKDSADKESWHSPPPSGTLLKRGQPDDECAPQLSMIRRALTLEESCESKDHGSSDMEDADPVFSVKDSASSDVINSASSTNEHSDDCTGSFNSSKKPVSSADDETISSELSGQGAVEHFKSLSISERKVDRLGASHTASRSINDETEGARTDTTTPQQQSEDMCHDVPMEDSPHEERAPEDSSIDKTPSVSSHGRHTNQKSRPIQFLQKVLSSATSSCSTSSKPKAQNVTAYSQVSNEYIKRHMELPQRSLDSEDDASKCPRIEVTLLSPKGSSVDEAASNTFHSEEKEEPSVAENSLQESGIVPNRTHKEPMRESANEDESLAESDNEEPCLKDLLHDETDILEISSTLTGGTRGSDGRAMACNKDEGAEQDHATQNIQPFDLSISCTKGKSFESKSSFSSHGVPSWRLDAADSLSDFTLEILHEQSDESTSYHIHRHMLAVGPRKSEFMVDVFRRQNSNKFQLTLDERASSFVPCLLDYIYCHDYSIDVTSENAMPLRQLGKIFKVIPLVVKVAGFILEDLDPSNMTTYVSESAFFQDAQVTELIVRRCAVSLQTIKVGDPLWAVMEPDLFLRIISSPVIDRRSLSPHLSILLMEFVTLHQYEIDLNLFTLLTSEEIVPTVDRAAALPLIELCERYSSKQCETLQKRCAHTMACFWKTTPHEERHRLFALLRNLPSAFTVDFLEIVETGRSSETTSLPSSNTLEDSEREIAERYSFSIGDLCDDLAGDDGYSVRETDEILLSWRLDPDISFSDWTIKVKHQNLKRGDIYHVHKQILSLGPYRSDFFAQVFRSKANHSIGRGSTTVELDHEAALVFPQVLDFIYTPEHVLPVTHENAIVLRFLARVLGVSLLSKEVLEFVCKDISLENVTEYLKEAYAFEDDRIIIIASKLCATQIQKIDMESPLLQEFRPDFFARVVASSDIKDSSKCHLTILITKYFSLHNLDEDILAHLLKHVEVPRIDCLSALKLLKILSQFEKSQEIETFDQLQRRCANILTENWNDIRDNHREEVFSIFPLLHPTLLTEIFDVIDHQYMVQHYESMSLQSRLVKRYRAQVAEANHLREQEVYLLQKELEERTAEMLAIQQSLEEKLGRVNDSLNRRTGRSAAYGIQLPSSPTNAAHRGKRETRIPRLRTKSPSTMAAERIRAAREAARKELNSATSCCAYTSVVQDRDDCSEPAVTERSSNNSSDAERVQAMDKTAASASNTRQSSENSTRHEQGEDESGDSTNAATEGIQLPQKEPAVGTKSSLPWSSTAERAKEDEEGEDAELSA